MVDEFAITAHLDHEDVAVDGEQVDEGAVDRVGEGALGAPLLVLLELADHRARGLGGVLALVHTELAHHFGLFAGVTFAHLRVGLGFRGLEEAVGGHDGLADAAHGGGRGDDGSAAFAHLGVAGERAGEADVRLGGARGLEGDLGGGDALAHEQVGDRGRGRDTQAEVAAARADRSDHVLGAGGAQQPHGVLGRLLDGFEQGVRAGLAEAVRVLDDDDAPQSLGGRGLRLQHEGTCGLHVDDRGFGGREDDVGVRAAHRRATSGALAAPDGLARALEGGREGAGGDRPTRPGRAGDEPGVAHGTRVVGGACAATGGDDRASGRRGLGELSDRRILSDERGPDAHHSSQSAPWDSPRAPTMVAGLRDEPLFGLFSRGFSGASATSGISDEDEAGVS